MLLLPSSVSVCPDLLKRLFCGVRAPHFRHLSVGSHPCASSALIQHLWPRRRDVRADRRHHLFVCYHHHHHCCVPLHLNLVQGGALSNGPTILRSRRPLWKLLTRSTRFTYFCRGQTLNFQQDFVKIVCNISWVIVENRVYWRKIHPTFTFCWRNDQHLV